MPHRVIVILKRNLTCNVREEITLRSWEPAILITREKVCSITRQEKQVSIWSRSANQERLFCKQKYLKKISRTRQRKCMRQWERQWSPFDLWFACTRFNIGPQAATFSEP